MFLSLPTQCRLHDRIVKEGFERQLKLHVESFNEPDSKNICETTLRMIRNLDFFFAIWHPDKDRPMDVSPWMPFEYGVARSLGKPHVMMAHRELPSKVRRRIDPSRGLVEYEDLTFRENLDKVIRHCKTYWIGEMHAGHFIDCEN